MTSYHNSNQGIRNTVQEIEVSENDAGQRIDNYLCRVLKGLPKNLIYKLLRKGSIRVNKGRKKPEYRLQLGDTVRIPPITINNPPADKTELARKMNLDWLESAIIYEDNAVLVINKPAGIAVHSGSGIPVGLIEALKTNVKEYQHIELVHRLDRETSGCLLLAKKKSVLRDLQQQLRDKQVKKYYHLLVKGRWRLDKKMVSAPLLSHQLQGGERLVKVDRQQGKQAITQFSPLKLFSAATLMRAHLITGRTHQIRVHAAYLSTPIAGDKKYGDKLFNRLMREQLGLKRLFLHAHEIEFCLPACQKRKRVSADLPTDLQIIIEKLE